MIGGSPAIDKYPFQGGEGSKSLSHFMLEMSNGLMGH